FATASSKVLETLKTLLRETPRAPPRAGGDYEDALAGGGEARRGVRRRKTRGYVAARISASSTARPKDEIGTKLVPQPNLDPDGRQDQRRTVLIPFARAPLLVAGGALICAMAGATTAPADAVAGKVAYDVHGR